MSPELAKDLEPAPYSIRGGFLPKQEPSSIHNWVRGIRPIKTEQVHTLDWFFGLRLESALEPAPVGGYDTVATYILLGKLTDEGRKTVNERPMRIEEVNQEVEGFGAKVIAQYATLGPYDFVTVIQAPDNETIARVSIEFGSRGTLELMSMPAFDTNIFVHQILAREPSQET